MDTDLSQKLNAILGDPAMMDKIKTIAGSLGAPSAPPREEHREEKSADCSSCPHKMPCGAQALCPVSGERSEFSKSIANIRTLLTALKPYLDSARCERIDKILGMMKIAEIMGYIK
ncbi:MAG: hypothetical protein E7608_01945 [Ruminococcaceae bacterium]|nr:hypothetical protein [Oscillospiraceae bacterium]MBO5005914.1 hypothetical protein [Clostridia bacterium]